MREDLATGTVTLHSRADAWECDFNGHWNTRFYCRSFLTAAEVGAALAGHRDAAATIAQGWHVRFHRELRSGDPVVIHSFDASGQGHEGGAHVLTSHGRIAATALDAGMAARGATPPLPQVLAPLVLPRGIAGPPASLFSPDPTCDVIVEMGRLGTDELHGDGSLRLDAAAARLATPTHHHAMHIGFTHDLAETAGVGRMLVELRYRALGRAAPGAFLRGATRMTAIAGKSFLTSNLLYTHDGAPLGLFELCTLAVDLKTRRATEMPDFMRAAARGSGVA